MTPEQVEAWRARIDKKREVGRRFREADAVDRIRRFAPDPAGTPGTFTVTCPTCAQTRQVAKRRPGSECRSCGARAGRLRALGRTP